MSVDVDVNDWPTKQEAAAQLDVSGKSIDDLLKQGRLKKRIRRGGGPPIVVVDPATIEECRQAPGTSVTLARIGDHRLARTRSGIAPSGLEAAFLAFLQSKIPSTLVPVERRIFLTMAESAEYSGLPVAFLRRLIASGKLKALRTGSGWRVSRAELEKSSGTLTDKPEDLTEPELRDMEINRRRRQGLA